MKPEFKPILFDGHCPSCHKKTQYLHYDIDPVSDLVSFSMRCFECDFIGPLNESTEKYLKEGKERAEKTKKYFEDFNKCTFKTMYYLPKEDE